MRPKTMRPKVMCSSDTAFPAQLMVSDLRHCPDWQAALARAQPNTGLVLRDYEAPERAALAAEMAAYCRRNGRFFAIAGDVRLARKLAAGFHCPSPLLARPALRLGRAAPHDSAAVHTMSQLVAAHRAGFRQILLSPVFATDSHPKAVPLGTVRAQILAGQAKKYGLRPYALGGLSRRRFARLAASDFVGWAGISAFQ